jgi:hypothetical protein
MINGGYTLVVEVPRPHWQHLSGQADPGRNFVRQHVNGICLRYLYSCRRLSALDPSRKNKHNAVKIKMKTRQHGKLL